MSNDWEVGMIWTAHFLLMVAIMGATATARSEEPPGRNAQGAKSVFMRCIDASEGITGASHKCFVEELGRKDAELNAVYTTVLRRLTPVKQKQLRILERRWVARRDSACMAEADKEVGLHSDDGRLWLDGCVLGKTEQRIEWLKAFGARASR